MYILKFKPAFKDYLWGGTKLRDEYKMECNLEKIAEAWVLSCHKDGDSIVTNGEFEGMTLKEVLDKTPSLLGLNAQKFEFFPILIKLIDAKQNLSVQVHPNDEFALKVEGEYGKTEMWYVVDCEKDAYLYYGFKDRISTEDFKNAIENNTLTDVLNKVSVKKGDCFFIESGTVHAIGAGLLIAEIQQNSNTTYRVYDYGRVGADGKPRELHKEKALQVTVTAPPEAPVIHNTSDTVTTLANCKYFTVKKYVVGMNSTHPHSIEINVDEASFSSILCVEGTATVGDIEIKAGECVFIPAGFGSVIVSGNAELLESRV